MSGDPCAYSHGNNDYGKQKPESRSQAKSLLRNCDNQSLVVPVLYHFSAQGQVRTEGRFFCLARRETGLAFSVPSISKKTNNERGTRGRFSTFHAVKPENRPRRSVNGAEYPAFFNCPEPDPADRVKRKRPSPRFTYAVGSSIGRAPGCGPGGWRFKSVPSAHGILAQLVEPQTENLCVPGSIPGGSTADKRTMRNYIDVWNSSGSFS